MGFASQSLLSENVLILKKKQCGKDIKERLQGETLNPLGAFILAPSGKSIS